jgi:hypothetical protein
MFHPEKCTTIHIPRRETQSTPVTNYVCDAWTTQLLAGFATLVLASSKLRWFLVGMSTCIHLLWCLSAGCYGHRLL